MCRPIESTRMVHSLIARGNVEKYEERHNLIHVPTWGRLLLEQKATHRSAATVLHGPLTCCMKLLFISGNRLCEQEVTKVTFSMHCVRRQKVSNILF